MRNKKTGSLRRMLRMFCVIILAGALAVGGFVYWLEGPFAKRNVAAVERDVLVAEVDARGVLVIPVEGVGGDKIHFLNTGAGDAILLESEGHFALVDCAEDTDNPKSAPKLALPGYEKYVLSYIKRVAKDVNGKVQLDFVLGTHCHSDHIGGFDTLFLDPDITVGKVFLKKYIPEGKNSTERSWDNKEVYQQMVDAANKRGFELIQTLPTESFGLGKMKITFYNTEDRKAISGGENDNAVGTLVEANERRVFLAADMNNWSGDEKRVAKQVGQVDLVKAGHHSHFGSGSVYFGMGLRPQYLVVTNTKAHLINLANYALFARSEIFTMGETGGLIAQMRTDGIKFYGIGDFETSEAAA
ncbi:MAG: MBL fold metallo-hydrolase [Oscillospiraceae bacterium]|nr:MBL fold metallo-hydrolase [Oscillospiraceae bacterium]